MAAPVATVVAPSRGTVQKGPDVNLFDIPEMMPGAKSSANPAQREHFARRCIQLYHESVDEEHEQHARRNAGAGSVATVADLEAMFPLLDAALVRGICNDVPTPQQAIETLLALNCAMSAPGTGSMRATTSPARDLGVEDHEKFPSLLDADGWQVAAQRHFDRDPSEDLGSAWRDRAEAVASKASPAAKASAWGPAAARSRQKKKVEAVTDDGTERSFPLTDYESRHRDGQRRAMNRIEYGRGSRSGKGGGKGVRDDGNHGGEDECYSEDDAYEQVKVFDQGYL